MLREGDDRAEVPGLRLRDLCGGEPTTDASGGSSNHPSDTLWRTHQRIPKGRLTSHDRVSGTHSLYADSRTALVACERILKSMSRILRKVTQPCGCP